MTYRPAAWLFVLARCDTTAELFQQTAARKHCVYAANCKVAALCTTATTAGSSM